MPPRVPPMILLARLCLCLLIIPLWTPAVAETSGAAASSTVVHSPVQGALDRAREAGSRGPSFQSCTNCVIANVSLGSTSGPVGIAYDPLNKNLYVADSNSNETSIVNGTTDAVTVAATGQSTPDQVTYDSVTRDIYVANDGVYKLPAFGYFTVINSTTGATASSGSLGWEPIGMAADTSNGDVYVANDATHNVSVVSGTTNKAITSIQVGNQTRGVAFDPANGYVYVTNNQPDNVSVINSATNKIVGAIAVGSSPYGVVYDPANGDLYVADQSSSNVTIISSSTGKTTGSVHVGSAPSGIALDTALNYLYVANYGSNNVSVINASTNAVVATIPVQVEPLWAAYDSATGDIFVTNYFSGTVSIISPTAVTTPTLSSVTLVASSANIATTGTSTLTATPSCSGGPCPAGSTYSWTLTNPTLGSLNSTTTNPVTFTAGSKAGTLSVYVNLSLGGHVAEASVALSISVPVLTSMSLSPSSSTIAVGGNEALTATPTCSVTCPGTITYVWAANNTLGSLTFSGGNSASFSAGSTAGSVQVTVTGSLNGTQMSANADITIQASTPVLSSISVSPTAPTVVVGGTVTLTPTPNCTGGTCPAGTTYTWSVNNSLGSVSPTSGPSTVFTAGDKPGSSIVFATGSLDGHMATGLASITIVASSVSVTALSVSPSPTSSVAVEKTLDFTTTPTCSVSPCPGSITYSWTLSDALGNLSSSTGATNTFTAGRSQGTDTLTVKASLDGTSQQATSVITITSGATVTLVAISPGSPSIDTDGAVDLLATPSCSPSPCPSGVTYLWTLNNTLGSLNATSGTAVDFTAGGSPGVAAVSVEASLGGHSANSSVTVVISPSTGGSHSSNAGFLGLPDDLGYVLIIAILAVIVVVAVVASRRRSRTPPPAPNAAGEGAWPAYPGSTGPEGYGSPYSPTEYPGPQPGPWPPQPPYR